MDPISLNNSIWITWERQRRSVELSDAFKSQLYILSESSSDLKPRLYRYFILGLKTIFIILSERPKLVFCQNPSIVLALILCLIKKLFGFVLVVDRHSNFKFHKKYGLKWLIFHRISNFTLINADLTIVTNKFLKDFIIKIGGRAVVLPDKLPRFKIRPNKDSSINDRKRIVVITSFNADEPISELLKAITKLNKDILFFMTGDFSKKRKTIKKYSNLPNLTFTGFLPENEYIQLLNSANVIVILTKQEHTLTCGAYESVSLKKPMVVSNTHAIASYFYKGAIYCDPFDPKSIAKSINEAIELEDELVDQVSSLRDELFKDWNAKFFQTLSTIQNLERQASKRSSKQSEIINKTTRP